MEPRRFKLRVTYGKSGRLALLSHLEVTHALERMVRRAELPFALSNGFSPHMKLSFGSALPVGIGSTCEIFDLTLDEYVPPQKALAALQGAAPAELLPSDAKYVEPSEKAASVAFPFSLYEAVFTEPVESVSWPDEIEVVRKKKPKTLKVADYLVGEPEVCGNAVRFQLQTKDTGSLRPDLFAYAMMDNMTTQGGGAPSLASITRISQGASRI